MQWGVAELWLHRPALCVQGWPQEQQPRWVHWSPSESGGQHEECMQFTPCTISITFGSRNTIWGLLFFFLWKQEVLTSFLKGNESIALFLVDHYNYNDLFPAITGQRSSKTFPGNHSCRSQENLCLPLLYVWQNKPHPLWKPKLITPASLVTCFFACSIDTNDQPIATDEFHGTLCFLQAEAFFGN